MSRGKKSERPPNACKNCGLSGDTHREAKTNPQVKNTLAVCDKFEQAKCEQCGKDVAPPMTGINSGFYGPFFCDTDCPAHLWEVDYDSPAHCIKCGGWRTEYLESKLKAAGIAYDNEWHRHPDDHPEEDEESEEGKV